MLRSRCTNDDRLDATTPLNVIARIGGDPNQCDRLLQVLWDAVSFEELPIVNSHVAMVSLCKPEQASRISEIMHQSAEFGVSEVGTSMPFLNVSVLFGVIHDQNIRSLFCRLSQAKALECLTARAFFGPVVIGSSLHCQEDTGGRLTIVAPPDAVGWSTWKSSLLKDYLPQIAVSDVAALNLGPCDELPYLLPPRAFAVCRAKTGNTSEQDPEDT